MSLVLVADDEPAVLEILGHVLEDLGHEVLRAHDGEEALALARARQPHLVVTDHMMPNLSGLELCRRLKKEPRLTEVPVILLSAVLPTGAPEASAFLHKPFEITEFEALVRRLLVHAPREEPAAKTAPVHALAQWVSRALQGPLDAARAQVRRLETVPSVDRPALDALSTQLQALESLGRDLRDAARLATGDLALRPVDADLTSHLRDAVASCPRKGQVTLKAPAEPVPLRFDPERIRQVLGVLLANAARRGDVQVEVLTSGSRVAVRVRDAGPGLPAEALSQLFEPFRTEPEETGGLGLYLASELARLHGGELSPESEPGRGSTFSLFLPRPA